MIQAIKELGEIKLKIEGRDVSDPLSILVQNPKPEQYPYTFLIVFKKNGTKLSYSHIQLEETSKD